MHQPVRWKIVKIGIFEAGFTAFWGSVGWENTEFFFAQKAPFDMFEKKPFAQNKFRIYPPHRPPKSFEVDLEIAYFLYFRLVEPNEARFRIFGEMSWNHRYVASEPGN